MIEDKGDLSRRILADNKARVFELLSKPAVVECKTCTACCKNRAIFVYEECGDDPAKYETVQAMDPMLGRWGPMLAHKENGDCAYLVPTGCGIHANRPAVCRSFDCAARFAMESRAAIRRLKRSGEFDAVWAAGERQWRSRKNQTTP